MRLRPSYVLSRKSRGLWTFALACLVVVGSHLALQMATPIKVRGRDEEFFGRAEPLAKRLAQARSEGRRSVVVIGSSRVEMGLRAQTIERLLRENVVPAPIVHNLGLTGAGPVIEWTVVRRLLQSDSPPDALVIEINPMFCSAEDGLCYDVQRVLNLKKLEPGEREELLALGWGRSTGERIRAATPRWFRDRSSLLANWGITPSRNLKPPEPWVDNRDAWGDWKVVLEDGGREHRDRKTLDAKQAYFDRLHGLEINELTHRLYEDMLSRCWAKKIDVAVLLMPEADRFREWYGPRTEPAIAGLVDRLRREWNARQIDTRTWFPEETAFFDGHHLLRKSGEAFSERLATEEIGPWLRDMRSRSGQDAFRTVSRP